MANSIPVSEVPAHPLVSLATPGPFGFLRLAWERWKKIARAIGVVQTRILLVLFYFVFVLPLGLIVRSTGDPLHLKARTGGNWTPHRQEKASLDSARRQF
jgi:hypothetical protein